MSDLDLHRQFSLPGADRFSLFLLNLVQGQLEIRGPHEAPALQIGGSLSDRLEIYVNGMKIGNYIVQRCENGDNYASSARFYRGRIPGFVNDLVNSSNFEMVRLIKQGRGEFSIDDLSPIDSFVLDYSSMRGFFDNGNGVSELRRTDMHWNIPFP